MLYIVSSRTCLAWGTVASFPMEAVLRYASLNIPMCLEFGGRAVYMDGDVETAPTWFH